jgi:DNA-binding GntR family transcriptional regulator
MLARLEQEGTGARKQGKGTYAAGKQLRHGLDQLRSFHESLQQQGLQAEMRLLSREIVGAPGGALSVMGDEDGRCLRLLRLHLLDGAPLLVMERSSYFAGGACCDRSQFYIRPECYEFVIKTSFAQSGG